MPRLAVFDLDDTLYPTAPFFGCALRRIAAYGSKKYGISHARLLASLRRTLAKKGPQHKHLFDDSFAQFGIGLSKQDLASLLKIFYSPSCYTKMRLYPGVTAAMARIRKGGAKIAIATKGSREKQRRAIRQLGIAKLADRIFYSQSMGHDKTSTAFWKRVFSSMRCKPQDSVCIGDNTATDLAVPRSLGARTVRLMKGFYGSQKKTRHEGYRIRNFSELGAVMKKINAMN